MIKTDLVNVCQLFWVGNLPENSLNRRCLLRELLILGGRRIWWISLCMFSASYEEYCSEFYNLYFTLRGIESGSTLHPVSEEISVSYIINIKYTRNHIKLFAQCKRCLVYGSIYEWNDGFWWWIRFEIRVFFCSSPGMPNPINLQHLERHVFIGHGDLLDFQSGQITNSGWQLEFGVSEAIRTGKLNWIILFTWHEIKTHSALSSSDNAHKKLPALCSQIGHASLPNLAP